MKGIAFLLLLLLPACSGDGQSPPSLGPPAGASQPAAVSPVDLSTADLAALVTWEDLLLSVRGEATPEGVRLLRAMEGRPEYAPFLFDLAFLPTPYREEALPLLFGRGGVYGAQNFLRFAEERGFKKPEDDPPGYVEFKQRLFSTIQKEMGAFLDPKAPRLIAAQEVMWGGVAVDGIPPLNDPRFVTPGEAARWINPSDQVIGVEINGDARAYPRRIIDWHEMVNDTVGGVPVSLAYCTLCGSAILYDGRAGGTVYRFGTSGMLYRSNKLMYDRNTRTLWEQYTGEPVWGPLAGSGIKLDFLPVVHTTYEGWLRDHPDTKVLDINTGFRRDYGPGVAYADYWASGDLIFPAPDRDPALLRKDWVYAVRLHGEAVAYPIALLAERSVIHDTIGPTAVVVIATEDRSGGRAYESNGRRFRLEAPDLLRAGDGSAWRITEAALVSDDGSELRRLPGHNSFWFAVTNHAPRWRLYGE
ncbi:MAG TPA: DUF3179 domain-containing protein [Dehalococcoidia bacterium]|nr:DUF3179 domain-containing protein [Dehalococcoidia bacterium]